MMEEEGAVIGGLLVGLNVIDANLCIKGEDLDSQVSTDEALNLSSHISAFFWRIKLLRIYSHQFFFSIRWGSSTSPFT